MGTPTVGIVGAGQLARMMVQAAIPLDIEIHLLAASAEDGAAAVASHVTVGAPDSFAAIAGLGVEVDVVTFDHELVDVAVLHQLESAGRRFYPRAATVAVAQDKALQHERFAAAGLPLSDFALVESVADIARFAAGHGWPVVAKATRGGYDGRGVWVLDDERAAARLVEDLTPAGIRLLIERRVEIEREIAVMVARRPGGDSVTYPVVETVQRNGICHELLVPAEVEPALAERAREIGRTVAGALDVVGILAVELFVSEGRVLVNEIACRPHNSGHHSIEGCETSQFENHLRAVLDWPLGSTALTAPAVATANILGEANTPPFAGTLPRALAVPGAHVHLYGKAPRPGRKVGHVTVTAADAATARARANEAAAILAGRA